MRTLLIAAALALAGCGQTGADGYEFGRAEFDRNVMTVEVVSYPSEGALRADAKRQGVKAEGELMAWATVGAVQPTCTIHIVDPAVTYRPEWIGHELTHCIRGRWHS